MTLKTKFFAAGAALALMTAPAAFAQDAGVDATMSDEAAASAMATEPAASGAGFTDAQVEDFAEAMTDVQALNEEYGAKVAAEADATAQTALQQEMTSKMTAAVEDSGLTATEYNQIAAAAQTDAELRARIGQAMQADAGAAADASANVEAAESEPDM
ncbi:DUF4168 domain-containing protein [Phenylobacterium sp.]|uniref:DUF4168 domain-containing protein n=1 Tax=Phenylobacterium sp. TaxID=1871053 RepID=UPI00272F381C|nr:DUF4168 domain-containing protein [Phenylobacterium sp.]MDP1617271.1 DUF4168 domain-containing protein [Phenylobacterium sp.]MDP1985806.1 DUF4168 domain-containing protein [Phenylobacterium sp.]